MNLNFTAFDKAITLLQGKRLKIVIEMEDKPKITDQSFAAEIELAQQKLDAKIAEHREKLGG